jgi:hypothetical protein
MKRILSLLAGLLVGLVLLLPARLLLPAPPLAAERVGGSIWRAELASASLGGGRIGDLRFSLAPAALLRGQLAWTMDGALAGRLSRTLAGAGAEAITGRIAGAPLSGLPVAAIDLQQLGVTLDGRGRCTAAAGQLRVTLSSALAGQTQLVGAARCEGAMLLVPLASADGRVRLDLVLRADGWQSRLMITGTGIGEAAALAAAGFRSEAGALVQQQEGRW